MNTWQIPLTHEQLTDYPPRRPSTSDLGITVNIGACETADEFQHKVIDALDLQRLHQSQAYQLGVVSTYDELVVFEQACTRMGFGPGFAAAACARGSGLKPDFEAFRRESSEWLDPTALDGLAALLETK